MTASLRRDGVEGNRRLTAMLGAVLLVLLAIEGGTIPFLSSLEVVHVVVGLVVIPVVLLKLASTTYRFARYYTRDAEYVRAGPPILILRAVGPLVAVTSAVLLGSGVALAVVGHHSWIYGIHKGSFIIWFGTMSVHVLGHLRSLPGLALRDLHHEQRLTSSAARRYLVAVVVLGGVVLAVLVYPQLPPWSNGFAGDR